MLGLYKGTYGWEVEKDKNVEPTWATMYNQRVYICFSF